MKPGFIFASSMLIFSTVYLILTIVFGMFVLVAIGNIAIWAFNFTMELKDWKIFPEPSPKVVKEVGD